jgi:hypothetical protein
MVHLEQTLAKAYRIKGDGDRSSHFAALAARREAAIRKLMWSARSHAFTDYAWRRREALPVTAAGLFPLFFHVANQHQAMLEAQTVRRKLLMPGGVATTLVVSGQQWDHPNGWAPLQWIAVVGLKSYNETQLAETIAKRWSCENVTYLGREIQPGEWAAWRRWRICGPGRVRLDQRWVARVCIVVSDPIEIKPTSLFSVVGGLANTPWCRQAARSRFAPRAFSIASQTRKLNCAWCAFWREPRRSRR